ncbi:MAG: penicillin-binding protein 2, partial [Clostridiales bacterium]|nr:penicillin-binding protein 2 [Clostridiales bacterium]
DVDIFNIPIRYSDEQIAPHIIGYTRDNIGVSGLERAYDDFLRGNSSQVSIEYTADGIRQLVLGDNKNLIEQKQVKAGVVTTLDKDIQKLAEKVARENEIKGAIVIMDPYSGEIKAMVSMPDFSPLSLEESVNDNDNYPLVNRALSGYNLGSIFKLATASAALEQGINPNFEYECKGYVDVKGQIMNCHKLDGHGVLDMGGAIVESCNTYFIELASKIDDRALLSTASALSFGKSVNLATGMRSVNGYLQNKSELYNPAEKANLSFGQGMLMATPIQVAQMTSAFVNDGRTPRAYLVKGLSHDGETIDSDEATPAFTNAISKSTAQKIKNFMIDTVEEESNEKFHPEKATAGGKTATAQTGKMDKDDKEILHGWLTGFTPAKEPKYVITILVEGGGYGSSSAGPAFAEICDKLYELEELRTKIKMQNLG